MRIGYLNQNYYNYSSFSFQKKYVKEADDIVRNSNSNFPVLSTSYLDKNWKTLNNGTLLSILERAYIAESCDKRLEQMRKTYGEDKNDKYLTDIFRKVKENKLGNCSEQAQILLGSLYASGQFDAIKASLRIKVDMLNNDGKKLASAFIPYDHATILANLNDSKNNRHKYSLVLDAWLNKAMSYEQAQQTYLEMIPKKDMEKVINKAKNAFKKELEKRLNYTDIDKYDYKCTVVFKPMTKLSLEQRQEFGQIVKEKYPELCCEF